MAIHGRHEQFNYAAGEDLSSTPFRFVKEHSTAGQAVKAGAGDKMLGIVKETNDTAGEPIAIVDQGIFKLEVDGSGTPIAVGDALKSDGSGKGVVTTTDDEWVGAEALEASSADGDIIRVKAFPAVQY